MVRHPFRGIDVEAVIGLVVIRTIRDDRKRSGNGLFAVDDRDALAIWQCACDVGRR